MGDDHTPPGPSTLSTKWRERAELLANFGDLNCARIWQLAAAELDEVLRALGAETLTLAEAARESGYSQDHIGSLLRVRSRRSYREVSGTPGAAIIEAAGPRPWPALTEAQEAIVAGRKRDAEAEQRDSTRFAAEGERALTRHGV